MKKIFSIVVLIASMMTAYAQPKDVKKMAELKVGSTQKDIVAADAAEGTVVSTETPNGTLWFTYDQSTNEATLDYLTRDSVVSKYNTMKVNHNKDLHGDIYLPEVIQNGQAKGARLVRIKNNAFLGCENINSITLPASAVEVEPSGLRTTTKLKALTIPPTTVISGTNHSGLQVTAYFAYTQTLVVNNNAAVNGDIVYWGGGIKTLIVGDEVESIGDMTFMQIDSLSSVTLGKNVKEIGYRAFMGCKSLRCIHLPASIKRIDKMAFHYGSGYTSNFTPTPLERIEVEDYETYKMLVDSMVYLQPQTRIYLAGNDITGTYVAKVNTPEDNSHKLEEGATEIPSNFFAGDTTLTSYTVPEGVTTIGYYAFENCTNLESIVIPNSVTRIESSAFGFCTKLKRVVLPQHLKVLSSNLFVGCTSLEEVVLNNELDTIEGVVFAMCSNLQSLTIPASVSNVYPDAFAGCGPQLQVTFESDKAGMTWENHMLLSTDKTILYDGSNLESNFYIPETVTDIRALPYNIENLHIPAQVEHLPQYMVYPMKAISVDKENRFFAVSDGALYTKDMKTLVAIPQSVTGRFVVPETVDSICTYAVRTNITNGYDQFALSVFRLDRVLPTQFDLSINSDDKLIYLLPNDYCTRYTWSWNKNVFDVATYQEPEIPEVSPMKSDIKQIDYYSLKVHMSEWPQGAQPSSLVIDGLAYNFNPVDSTFFVDRIDTINVRLQRKQSSYNTQRYIPYTIYAQKGSDIVPLNDSIYYSASLSLFSLNTIATTYTSTKGFIYLKSSSRDVNSDEFEVECVIRKSMNYPNNYIIDTKVIKFNRSDMTPRENLNGLYGYDYEFDGLKPGNYITMNFYAYYNGERRGFSSKEIDIPDFVMYADHLSCGTTTVGGRIMYDAKNLPVIMTGVKGHGSGKYFSIPGLNPGAVVPVEYYVTALIGGKDTTFTNTIYLPLQQLELTTQIPTEVNNRSARLNATTTIDDAETAVGFEWRRYDAPEEMQSYRIDGTVYNGKLMATLNNLEPTTYYRCRPYLQTADSTYYGEWLIFGTNGLSGALLPELFVTDAIMDAEDAFMYHLIGYVLPGSENIEEQGFEYWPASQKNSRKRVRAAAETVNSVNAKGLRMTAAISCLQPLTTYVVRTFATTESQTTYSNELTFTTTALTGINGIFADDNPFDVYNVSGQKVRHQATSLQGLPKGVYVVNGRKVIVK